VDPAVSAAAMTLVLGALKTSDPELYEQINRSLRSVTQRFGEIAAARARARATGTDPESESAKIPAISLNTASELAGKAAVMGSRPDPALRRRWTARRDQQVAVSLLSIFIMLFIVVKVSIAEVNLPAQALADLNEIESNLSFLITVCCGYLTVRSLRK
jgi:hypothetical protein